jgi:hypothetical protein
MSFRPRRPLVAAVLVAGAVLGGGTAATAATVPAHPVASAADRPVSRFVAWQACKAAVWEWVAQNAAVGTKVDTHLNGYRSSLEWRDHGGWFVQIAGAAHEPVTANNRSSYCLVKGADARPKIVRYAYPR